MNQGPISDPVIKRDTMLIMIAVSYSVLLAISTGWLYFGHIELMQSMIATPKYVAYGTAAGLATSTSCYLMFKYCRSIPGLAELIEFSEAKLSPMVSQMTFIDIVFAAFVSGFVEEIFFRGVLQNQFGIVGASLAFGFVHFPGTKYLAYVAFATLMGFLLGFLYMKTGCLWTPIAAHILHNLISLTLLRFVIKPAS